MYRRYCRNRRFFRSRALYRATASRDWIGNPAGLKYLAKPSTAAFLCISLRCRPGLSIPACFPIDLFSGFLLRLVRSPMSLTPYDGRPRLISPISILALAPSSSYFLRQERSTTVPFTDDAIATTGFYRSKHQTARPNNSNSNASAS